MDIVSTLEKIAGQDRVSTSETVCQAYQFNAGRIKSREMKPDIVVLPQTTEQVSEIIKAANQYKVPVTPKGVIGSSGLGGTLRGGILLDLSLMDNIVHLDVPNMKVIAEAGCSY
jgi:glycolate oxidase